jgi:hypothetical protein
MIDRRGVFHFTAHESCFLAKICAKFMLRTEHIVKYELPVNIMMLIIGLIRMIFMVSRLTCAGFCTYYPGTGKSMCRKLKKSYD